MYAHMVGRIMQSLGNGGIVAPQDLAQSRPTPVTGAICDRNIDQGKVSRRVAKTLM